MKTGGNLITEYARLDNWSDILCKFGGSLWAGIFFALDSSNERRAEAAPFFLLKFCWSKTSRSTVALHPSRTRSVSFPEGMLFCISSVLQVVLTCCNLFSRCASTESPVLSDEAGDTLDMTGLGWVF